MLYQIYNHLTLAPTHRRGITYKCDYNIIYYNVYTYEIFFYRLLIGAPRALLSERREGGVYKCTLEHGATCKMDPLFNSNKSEWSRNIKSR